MAFVVQFHATHNFKHTSRNGLLPLGLVVIFSVSACAIFDDPNVVELQSNGTAQDTGDDADNRVGFGDACTGNAQCPSDGECMLGFCIPRNDEDMGQDDMGSHDMSLSADLGLDATMLDAGPTLGLTCPGADTYPPAPDECDVVDQGCPTDQYCAVVVISPAPNIAFGARCTNFRANAEYSLAPGMECDTTADVLRCTIESFCNSAETPSVCRTMCELGTGRGCDPDGSTPRCAPLSRAHAELGLGFCMPTCDLP